MNEIDALVNSWIGAAIAAVTAIAFGGLIFGVIPWAYRRIRSAVFGSDGGAMTADDWANMGFDLGHGHLDEAGIFGKFSDDEMGCDFYWISPDHERAVTFEELSEEQQIAVRMNSDLL